MRLVRLHVLTPVTVRALVDQAGPVNKATRALLLIGAHAAGLDLNDAMDSIHTLIGCQTLTPSVRLALQRTLDRDSATCSATSHSPSERQNRLVPASQPDDQNEDDEDDDQEPATQGDWLAASIAVW